MLVDLIIWEYQICPNLLSDFLFLHLLHLCDDIPPLSISNEVVPHLILTPERERVSVKVVTASFNGPEKVEVPDDNKTEPCPGESHVQSLPALEEADAFAAPDTGDDDDVPLTALEPVHSVHLITVLQSPGQPSGDVLLLLTVEGDHSNAKALVDVPESLDGGQREDLLCFVEDAVVLRLLHLARHVDQEEGVEPGVSNRSSVPEFAVIEIP